MILRKSANRLFKKANVVGTVHSSAGLEAALRLTPAHVDLVEARVDAFADRPDQLLPFIPKLQVPLIVTVRHHLEGGSIALPVSNRKRLYELFLPHAAFIDIELRSLRALSPILDQARARGVKIILSYHNFHTTPARSRLSELVCRAADAGADVIKIATTTSTPRDLANLLSIFQRTSQIPLSVMGMGQLGKVSRLLFARAGSVLNYGFLDKAQVPGQWPAELLKERLAEL